MAAKYRGSYRASCELCGWRGTDRWKAEVALADQERHADSRRHQLRLIERDADG